MRPGQCRLQEHRQPDEALMADGGDLDRRVAVADDHEREHTREREHDRAHPLALLVDGLAHAMRPGSSRARSRSRSAAGSAARIRLRDTFARVHRPADADAGVSGRP